jgi:hypothetical protein
VRKEARRQDENPFMQAGGLASLGVSHLLTMTRPHVLAALLAASLIPGPIQGQMLTWSPRRSSSADLWFHSLAVLGVTGFGAVPLYAADYAAAAEREKAMRGSHTLLDRRAAALRQALAEDSAFEVLHFAPLYFAGSEPVAMLDALQAVAREGPDAAAHLGPAERFGAVALGTALPSPAERRLLGELAAALEDEWLRFYRQWSARSATLRARQAEAVAQNWRPLAVALAPYLARRHLDGGALLLSPALGADGRLFEGDPRSSTDNVVAVAVPASDTTAANAVFLAVRELCYPAVRAALAVAGGVGDDRIQGERLSGRAAVRCGALLLQRYAPESEAAYERTWLAVTGEPGLFPAAFPIPEALKTALATEVSQP